MTVAFGDDITRQLVFSASYTDLELGLSVKLSRELHHTSLLIAFSEMLWNI